MTTEVNKLEITIKCEIDRNINDLISKTKNNRMMWTKIEKFPDGYSGGLASLLGESKTAFVDNVQFYVFREGKNEHFTVVIELKDKSWYFKAQIESTKINQLVEAIDHQISENTVASCQTYAEFLQIMKEKDTD